MFQSKGTSLEIEEVYNCLMQSKTPEERLKMGLQIMHAMT